jgi:hypothetical protein
MTAMIFVRKAIRRCVLFAFLLIMVSCEKTQDLRNDTTKTVLVYMAADNNLSAFARRNIYSMRSSMGSDLDFANLLVFVDRQSVNPVLLHIHDYRIDTVKVYDKLNSADASVLKEVIETVTDNWKAESYGLVLWSHGMAWVPEAQMHTIASDQGWAPMRERPKTKTFAAENLPDDKYTCMEIDDLVDAIPEGVFDYIAFDACYMGSVEVAYALRNKTKYIISSSCEIVDEGFPYGTVTRDFINGNLLKMCSEFYSYYNRQSGWHQTASISLVDTDGLDSLARCFRKIVAAHKSEIPTLDISDIQHCDRFDKHVMFDLEDFVDKLGTERDDLMEFRLQLEKCILYKNATPYICSYYPDDPKGIKMVSFSGLSVYIPLESFEASGLNDDYRDTEWSRDTGY